MAAIQRITIQSNLVLEFDDVPNRIAENPMHKFL